MTLFSSATFAGVKEVHVNQTDVKYTFDVDEHRGIIAGIARATGEGIIPDHKYMVRLSCVDEHAIKCDYAVDLINPAGTLKLNYLVGTLYGSHHSDWHQSDWKRTGKLNVLKKGEMYPSDTRGVFKAKEEAGTNTLTLDINLAKPGKADKILSLDLDNFADLGERNNDIKQIKEYNTLRFDEDGVAIGGFVDVGESVETEDGVETIVRTAVCMPHRRFGQMCTLSEIRIKDGAYEPGYKMGRIEGEKMLVHRDELIIPWRLYGDYGRREIVTDENGKKIGINELITVIKETGEISHSVELE